MELPQETEDYIRESIDHSVGLPVSAGTLLQKLRAVEASNVQLRHQYLSLLSKLKEKDDVIERSRAEASMNAAALKKFVEENQKLAAECSNLLAACNKWESECSLYDRDREALMDFANEADERAKVAEIRIGDMEEERKKLMEELQRRSAGPSVDATDDMEEEQTLLVSLLSTMLGKDETASTAHSFLVANGGLEFCQRLLVTWTSLRPLTQTVVALAAEAKNLEREKDHLKINLGRAEEEVKVLFERNDILNEENKRLMRQCYKEKRGSAFGNKGKRKSCPLEKQIEFGDENVQRQPLSPLQINSPESRMHKKL